MLADMWFRLLDIRDIVSENTPAKIAEQKQLRSKRYNDRNEKSWFADRQALLDGELWAERDAQNRGETERIMRELRDDRFEGLVRHGFGGQTARAADCCDDYRGSRNKCPPNVGCCPNSALVAGL